MRFIAALTGASAVFGSLAVFSGIWWIAGLAAVFAGAAAISTWRLSRTSAPTGKADGRFSAQLITVQEEERKRLSRELHDSVGQIITAMKMELARVEGRGERDAVRLERARAHADEALETIRNVSRMLRPTLLDDLGLQATLEWHTSEFTRRTGIQCRLNYGLSGNEELPEALNTCIYRVVQEALNNCEKHAQATEVRVSATRSHQDVQVQIVDNGRGIEAEAPGAGQLGILGMRERAHMLGGALQLESMNGHGTSVTLTIPARNTI